MNRVLHNQKLSGSLSSLTRTAFPSERGMEKGSISFTSIFNPIKSFILISTFFAKAFFGGLPDGTNEDAVQALQKAIELNTGYLVYTYV